MPRKKETLFFKSITCKKLFDNIFTDIIIFSTDGNLLAIGRELNTLIQNSSDGPASEKMPPFLTALINRLKALKNNDRFDWIDVNLHEKKPFKDGVWVSGIKVIMGKLSVFAVRVIKMNGTGTLAHLDKNKFTFWINHALKANFSTVLGLMNLLSLLPQTEEQKMLMEKLTTQLTKLDASIEYLREAINEDQFN